MKQKTTLTRHAPYFTVGNVESAGEYYQNIFGFKADYIAGEPAQFAIYSRDGLAVLFRLIADANKIVPNEAQGGTWDAFFWVNDVYSLFKEFQTNGAMIVYGVIYQATYGMDEFAIRDLNGYVLGFGQVRT